MGVQVPREIRHARDLDETEVERDQLACLSLKPRLSRRESPTGQEEC